MLSHDYKLQRCMRSLDKVSVHEAGEHLRLHHGHAVVAGQQLFHNDGQAPEGVFLIHEQQQAASNEVHALYATHTHFQPLLNQVLPNSSCTCAQATTVGSQCTGIRTEEMPEPNQCSGCHVWSN